MDIFKKYLKEDDLDGMGGQPPVGGMGGAPMGGGLGMDGGSGGKKLDQVPGNPKEKAIAAASAAVDGMKKQLLSIDELETMRDKLTKYCDDFKNALKSKITDGLSVANRPWSDDNEA